MDREKILKAGKIANEVKEYSKSIIKKGVPLLEIAEKIEKKIIELGGKPAFPTNLSINEIAAHYTPNHDDTKVAEGLLKVDLGVHIDGFIADTAYSIDLEKNEINKKLIEASKNALKKAEGLIKENISTSDIGEGISKEIESYGFSPIINLSGHEMEEYELHAGLTIPNVGIFKPNSNSEHPKNERKEQRFSDFNDKKNFIIEKGLYAIEPFATNGNGKVKDGKPSGIYMVVDSKNVRSPLAREVLDFILDEYQTLPFCERWIVKKFGIKGILGLRQLEQNGNLHHYNQLVEVSGGIVSQAENTVLIEKGKVIVTTED